MKKGFSLFLALSLIFSLAIPAVAAEESSVPPYQIGDRSGQLVILHTNDTHGADLSIKGASIGTAGVAQLKKDFEAAGAEVLLLSSGDVIQGAPLVNQDKGASAISFMNAAQYDAMTLGNHEFDYGQENLMELAKSAKFPILCANILVTETGKPLFEGSKIFTTASGKKVGVFGLITPETATSVNPKYVAGLTFLQGEKLYECAQAEVNALKEQNCDLIVAIGHLGIDDGTAPNRSIDLCKQVKGIDLFIDGHSHSTTENIIQEEGSNLVNGTLIVSTGTKLTQVGAVSFVNGAVNATAIPAAAYTAAEPTVAKRIETRNQEVDQSLSLVFAKAEVKLDGNRAPGVRTQETNLGDFATDAMLWQTQQYLGDSKKVDAALTNGGGIRASIEVGDISMKDMKTVFPFDNTLYTLELTGAQLLEFLEANSADSPTASGGFQQVSGMTYCIDTTVPYEKGAKYGDTTYYAPANPGSRIKDVTVGGQPLDLTKVYLIVTNDFTAAGGDASYVLHQAKNGFNTTINLEEALIHYTKEVLHGTIQAEKYGSAANRIQVKYVGVEPGTWYVNAAKYVMDEGIMVGSDSGFEPSATVTRGMVFQTLYNMEGKPAVAEKASFSDVNTQWYADAAAWAEDTNLTSGTGLGFEGDRAMTRQEVAKVFSDYAAYQKKDMTNGGMGMKEAPDYPEIAAWALHGMSYCYYANVLKGDQNGYLHPTGTTNRAELATILMNYSKAA